MVYSSKKVYYQNPDGDHDTTSGRPVTRPDHDSRAEHQHRYSGSAHRAESHRGSYREESPRDSYRPHRGTYKEESPRDSFREESRRGIYREESPRDSSREESRRDSFREESPRDSYRAERPRPHIPPAPSNSVSSPPRKTGGWLTPKPKLPGTPPLPKDRNTIWCQNHGPGRDQQHDPRFCRGKVKGGRLHVCVRCGNFQHLFDDCPYGIPTIDDRDFFLFYPRQGLAPVATKIGCEDLVATVGRHVRPVLSVAFAAAQGAVIKRNRANLIFDPTAAMNNEVWNYRNATIPEFAVLDLPQDPSLQGYRYGPPPNKGPDAAHTVTEQKRKRDGRDQGQHLPPPTPRGHEQRAGRAHGVLPLIEMDRKIKRETSP